MKILHAADYVMPTMGYQDFMLAKWHAKHGHESHIVTSDRFRPVDGYEKTWEPLLGKRIVGTGIETAEDVTIHRLPRLLEWKKRVWLKDLRKTIERIKPDAVFCHGTGSPMSFALPSISKRLGLPILMDNHMTFASQRSGVSGFVYYSARRALTRVVLNRTVDRFLGIGQECCDFMIERQAIPPDKVELLEVGVDSELFHPDESLGKAEREKINVPLDAKVVIQTGKLARDKSPHWLSEAMAPIMREDPQVWLVFVGDAPADYSGEITSPMVRNGVADRLKFVPLVPVHELAAMFNMADVCVYPNQSSLSCMEAAACGKPVVVTDLPWGRARQDAGIATCYL
ncbi:MAG: glycosyltransferase family 4 protein, partial [Pirellulaceae bacterium]|nr:glycosyltransferase family 4 protein [Pirellulaceae bacterium]